MHEQSLVRALLSQVREACYPLPASVAEEIVVAIGPLAGVEPLLVASAFELLTRDSDLAAARLTIEQTPLGLTCNACGSEFERSELAFDCPSCGTLQTRVTAGDAVVLRQIVLREPQPEGALP